MMVSLTFVLLIILALHVAYYFIIRTAIKNTRARTIAEVNAIYEVSIQKIIEDSNKITAARRARMNEEI